MNEIHWERGWLGALLPDHQNLQFCMGWFNVVTWIDENAFAGFPFSRLVAV